MPFIDDDGTRRIDTHTGETQHVDDTLLEALRTRELGTTVNDISDRLAAVDGSLRAVIPDGNGGFIDLTRISTDGLRLRGDSSIGTGMEWAPERGRSGDRHRRRPAA